MAAEHGVYAAPLHYKGLEMVKTTALKQARGNYNAMFCIPEYALHDIQWWADNIINTTKSVCVNEPSLITESDASGSGWGVACNGQRSGGAWSAEETAENHINWLELKAAFFALQIFCKELTNVHVRMMIDNTTAVACINRFGSKKYHLFQLVREIYDWAIHRHIQLSAMHIPGRLNTVPDEESRNHNLDTEWQLKPHVFKMICKKLGVPSIDLFATRINTQVKRYVSWRPDPTAVHVDSFTLSWKGELNYAFPPFSVVSNVLRKMDVEGAELLLITPLWPTRPLYPRVMRRLVDFPLILPQDCLWMPQKPCMQHPLGKNLKLCTWKVSGNLSNWKEFHMRLPNSLQDHGDPVRKNNTMSTLSSGWGFVGNGKVVRFHQI